MNCRVIVNAQISRGYFVTAEAILTDGDLTVIVRDMDGERGRQSFPVDMIHSSSMLAAAALVAKSDGRPLSDTGGSEAMKVISIARIIEGERKRLNL